MKVKLINKEITSNFIPELLKERGINDVEHFLNPTEQDLQTFKDLVNIDKGVQLIANLRPRAEYIKIGLIVDSDVDGFTSSAIIYQYLKRLGFKDIVYYIHDGKQHGLEDMWEQLQEESYDLIICPDSASNDAQYAEQLSCPILVLDHHISDIEPSSNMIVINNQNSPNYKNKNLSGAGITYQFCRALDEYYGNNWAEDYIDLAAVGIDGDMCSGLEIENQYIWKVGFSSIRNYFLKVLLEKQAYSMNNEINPISVAFYIVPLINAMIRVGTEEEKQRLFLAFINGHEMVPCNKRGAKGTMEEVAIESARECTNAKNRQNKIKEKMVEVLEQKIFKYDLLENKILFIELDDEDDFPPELNGLTATQISQKYKKPTIIARLNNDGFYRGSARGINNGPLDSFKDYLSSTGLFEYTLGHDMAFGQSISKDNVDYFLELSNKQLANLDFGEKQYNVNFICKGNTSYLNDLIIDIDKYRDIYSQQNDEPLIYISDINLVKNDIQIIGSNHDTVKIIKNNIVYIMFHAKDLINELAKYDNIHLDIIGRGNVNYWGGNITPQIIINDYQVSDGRFSF